MTLATALAELKASLDAGNEALTTKHFRLLIEALEDIDVLNVGWLDFATPTTLTIESGVITPTQSFHLVDTEGAAAADDIDTIAVPSGLSAGAILILRPVSAARVVTLKDGTGNLQIAGDMVLATTNDLITLFSKNSTTWNEISRSNA